MRLTADQIYGGYQTLAPRPGLGKPGQGEDIVCARRNTGQTCDVGSSQPGAGAGPKGWAVRPFKRHASWVQNVESLRLLRVTSGCSLAISVKPHLHSYRTRRGQ